MLEVSFNCCDNQRNVTTRVLTKYVEYQLVTINSTGILVTSQVGNFILFFENYC